MKLKGNIVITDPCYIMTDSDFDKYSLNVERFLEVRSSFFKDIIHKKMHNDIVFKSAYVVDDAKLTYEKIKDFANDTYNDFLAENLINRVGKIASHSGSFVVCYYEDILNYNRDFYIKMQNNGTVAVTIKDFNGEINISEDNNFIGIGNKQFFTF